MDLLLHIDPQQPWPLQRQVYDQIRAAILEGRLVAGERLPSTRNLSLALGISRNTVSLAYEQLISEGYLDTRVGSGSYVCRELPDGALTAVGTRAAPRARPRQVRHGAGRGLSAWAQRVLEAGHAATDGWYGETLPYDFRLGSPTFDGAELETWRRLIGRALRRPQGEGLGYGPSSGWPPLRQAIAAYLGRSRGVRCRAEQVMIVNGSQQVLDLVSRLFVDPGDRVVMENPTYHGARRVFSSMGAAVVPVPVDDQGIVTSALPREAMRLVYVTPSHQFPTGVTMSLARRLALLEWAAEADALVLEDDYDSQFRFRGRPVEALQGLDRAGRVIYAGTFSKVMFPALRCGYAIMPEAYVEAFSRAKWQADRHTTTIEQQALAEFITDGHFERHLRRMRLLYAERQHALLEAIGRHLGDRVRVEPSDAGMHLLLWLGEGLEEEAVAAAAARHGVGVYPAGHLWIGPPARQALLLGFTSLDESQLREGIARLARAFEESAQSRAAARHAG